MKFLPHRRFTLETSLTPDEVCRRLKAVTVASLTEEAPALRSFSGQVREDGFRLRRVTPEKGGFRPRIRGAVQRRGAGSDVHVRLSLPIVPQVFMLIWGGIIFMAGYGFWREEMGGKGFHPVLLVPVALLVFGWGLTLYNYRRESRNIYEELRIIIKDEDR